MQSEDYMNWPRYEGAVYRPPSEAYSLIVQVTYGCSHNTCAFCGMFKAKPFRMRPMDEILEDFRMCRKIYRSVGRIFLADGDALIRKFSDLALILDTIRELFPECERVAAYASPMALKIRTDGELDALREKGLSLLYMGLESGSDKVLTLMNKGHSVEDIVRMGQKAKAHGFALSISAISGLGGNKFLEGHAIGTAKAINAMNPEYAALLTLVVERDAPLRKWVEDGSFQLLSPADVLRETLLTVENFDSPGTVFRMNHASNYLTLRGTLNRDKEAMIRRIKDAQSNVDALKPESWRAL